MLFVMDTAHIIDLVSSLGFPIVMCAALFYYMVNQRKAHSAELDNLRTTLEENTKVLTELSTLIKLIANEKER